MAPRGEGLNVIFYQNMPNLHNRYISAERKISQKNPEYMLNYFLLTIYFGRFLERENMPFWYKKNWRHW
jgi:hypothetical protein